MITNSLFSCTVGANMTYTKVVTLSVYLVEIRTSRKEIMFHKVIIWLRNQKHWFSSHVNKIKSKASSKIDMYRIHDPRKRGALSNWGFKSGFQECPNSSLPYGVISPDLKNARKQTCMHLSSKSAASVSLKCIFLDC